MKLLLDTHIFIWWDSQPERLSERVLSLCRDPQHEVLLSRDARLTQYPVEVIW